MEQDKKNLLVFGYGLGLILALFAARTLRHGGPSWLVILLLAAAVGLALLTWRRYPALRPFYRNWLKVARAIGTIISTVILTVFFYVVFGLTGLVLRLLKKDILDQSWPGGRESYWRPRESVPKAPGDDLRQF